MILRRIERYLKSHRVPPARFGRLAVGDPRFVFDLRIGREPRPATERRVSAYLDQVELPPAGCLDGDGARRAGCQGCRWYRAQMPSGDGARVSPS